MLIRFIADAIFRRFETHDDRAGYENPSFQNP